MIDVKTKFISVLIFNITPEDLPAFAREGTLVMQRRVPTIPGFVEGALMVNEDKTEVLAVSQWESRHAWSVAQWNEDIARTLGDMVEGAKNFEIRSYEPISVVRAP